MRRLFASFLAITLSHSTPAAAQQVDISSGSIAETVSSLRPGQYVCGRRKSLPPGRPCSSSM